MTTPVGVNLLWCVPGQVGGSEEYLVRQLLGLADLEHEFAPVLFALGSFRHAHPEVAERYPIVSPGIAGTSRPARIAYEASWLARQCRARRLPLVHHGGGTVPLLRYGTPVLTLHDLQYRTFPDYFGRSRLAYLRAVVPTSVRRAATVAVPSAFVRGTVEEAFAYPRERIVVVPHGLDPSVGTGATDPETLRRRYDLPGRFVVYPAVTHPHKNHAVLVQAFAALVADEPDLRLLLIGGAGRAEHDVAAEVTRLGLGGRVVRPGRVPAGDRDGLVALADVLAFPSRYEGFGAPVLEAMHLGTPVVAADGTALPEVCGAAALLVPPRDPAPWAGALRRVLHEPADRAELVMAGRERAAHFTAARSAAALLGAYRLARS